MRLKPPALLFAFILVFLGTAAWADQIVLKDGMVYSGKFIRGDSRIVDFRVLGKVESFKVADISQIIFREPELEPAIATPPPPPVPPAQTAEQKSQHAGGVAKAQTARHQPLPADESTAPRASREPAPQPASSSITVPAGMSLTIRTTTEIDTDRNRVGDPFDAVLEDDLMSGTQIVAPRGSLVKGRIAYAQESGKLSGQAQMILELNSIVIDGKTYPIRTSDYTEVGSSRTKRTAATVGGTAALGAIIGAIAGGGKGAAIGAASGAAVGTGVQVVTRGQVLRIPAETLLEFKLQSPLTVETP